MAEGDGGILLYLDQEGRGNGIAKFTPALLKASNAVQGRNENGTFVGLLGRGMFLDPPPLLDGFIVAPLALKN